MRYLHLDVFTSKPFTGNQLAVFPTPGPISADVMQAIAKEMAFSETTFVFPPERGGDVKMRIFTPSAELPMAGHPTIGSTFALAFEGAIPRDRDEFVFELGVGPTPVSLDWEAQELTFAWMLQALPTFDATFGDRAALARALSVETTALVVDLPAQVVSCGVPFLFVPLTTRLAVDAVTIDRRLLLGCYEAEGFKELPVFVFTTDPDPTDPGVTVYSRMLAPVFGIPEDPATGGASGPLGSYLLHHRLVSPEGAGGMVSLQGAAMGRPSRIHISIDGEHSRITRVRVGGESVLVGRGELTI